jgi:hypothetical protein
MSGQIALLLLLTHLHAQRGHAWSIRDVGCTVLNWRSFSVIDLAFLHALPLIQDACITGLLGEPGVSDNALDTMLKKDSGAAMLFDPDKTDSNQTGMLLLLSKLQRLHPLNIAFIAHLRIGVGSCPSLPPLFCVFFC